MIKTALLRPVAVAVSACFLLAACVSDGNKPTTTGPDGQPQQQLTPEEQRLRQQADTFNQTMVEGAIVGCLGGMLLGALVAGKGNRAAGVAAGCAVGGGIGAGAGAYVADKQEQYANTEQRYNAMIDDVHKDNERLAGLIQTARTTIAADKGRIEQIDADLAAKKITMDQAKTKMAHVDENTAYLQKTIASLKDRRDNYVAAAKQTPANSNQKAQMDKEINALQTQIAQLDDQLGALVARRKVSNVG